MKKITTNEVVNVLLEKEIEINNRIATTISEVLRLGYDSERGEKCVRDLKDSIEHVLDEIERVLNR